MNISIVTHKSKSNINSCIILSRLTLQARVGGKSKIPTSFAVFFGSSSAVHSLQRKMFLGAGKTVFPGPGAIPVPASRSYKYYLQGRVIDHLWKWISRGGSRHQPLLEIHFQAGHSITRSTNYFLGVGDGFSSPSKYPSHQNFCTFFLPNF
jgi:hypothetical protein